jgi:hypothetical protein
MVLANQETSAKTPVSATFQSIKSTTVLLRFD